MSFSLRLSPYVLLLALVPFSASYGQQGKTIDLFDGETLYKEGWLFTLGYEFKRKSGLRENDAHRSDPLNRKEIEHSAALAVHYGVRQDLQLTLLMPYFYRESRERNPTGPDRLEGSGVGDVGAFVKWRFYRWDAPHVGANFSVIAGLEFPTGDAGQKDRGIRLKPGLQPGSGSWDPVAGLAISVEPYRWKFGVSAAYKVHTEGPKDYRRGDQFVMKVAIGNRVWVEQYPGPSLRLEIASRIRHADRDRQDGRSVKNTGGESVSLAFSVNFHPIPEMDIVVEAEAPLYRRARGTQLETDIVASFLFGYRY